MSTLSFHECLQIKRLQLPELPSLRSLRDLFDWAPADFQRATGVAGSYVGHFHEYLVRGGFPQTAQVDSVTQTQRLLREDILDKVLKRDMTALFGVRRVLELEHTFLSLCLHDGGLLDMGDPCSHLEVKRPGAALHRTAGGHAPDPPPGAQRLRQGRAARASRSTWPMRPLRRR